MHTLRKLKRSLLMEDIDIDSITNDLQSAGVPITTDPCRLCVDPCTEGHEPYPGRFDVDMETRMAGSVKPYARQVVISTGKSDWVREVTDESGSLAAHLLQASSEAPKHSKTTTDSDEHAGPRVDGIFKESDTTRVTILNGSHHTVSEDHGKESVLVFPDFTVVTNVPKSLPGGQSLWKTYVDPSVPKGGQGASEGLSAFALPYSVVILLCSHKRRDNRCAIAAPKLEHRFAESLETRGWTVDTQIDDHSLESPLEGDSDRQNLLSTRLKHHASEKRALILKISHIGGHKFAGNVNIYLPKGMGIWYGRVTTHEVDSIVENTIEGGKILPALLRGGLNLAQPGCKTLHDW